MNSRPKIRSKHSTKPLTPSPSSLKRGEGSKHKDVGKDEDKPMGFSCESIEPIRVDATSMDLPPIFERLKLVVGYWKLLDKDFGRLFSLVAIAGQERIKSLRVRCLL